MTPRAERGAAQPQAPDADLESIGSRYGIRGEYADGRRYGSGHINDTFAVTYDQAGTEVRYIFQRINDSIFTAPEVVVGNIVRVLDHLGSKLRADPAQRDTPDRSRRALTLLSGADGEALQRSDDGRAWRVYLFIEGARSHDVARSPIHAMAAGRAFGEFETALLDLPGPPLAETIPRFHDLPHRFGAFEEAARRDTCGRAGSASADIERCAALFDEVSGALVKEGANELPSRVVHNDCKLNNVLIDERTGEGICVIDLDTVMVGSVLADFGDMVRSTACRAAEDETDLARVSVDLDLFSGLAQGYLGAASQFLSDGEMGALRLAGPALTLETALRFLTDHLDGDHYFKIRRPGHNLDRCRSQLRLIESMAEHRRDIEDTIAEAAGQRPDRLDRD